MRHRNRHRTSAASPRSSARRSTPSFPRTSCRRSTTPSRSTAEHKGVKLEPDRRGAAAPRRRPRPLRRPGQHRRPGPRHGLRRHRRAGHGARRQGHAGPRVQPARRADRRPRPGRRPRSTGRSTATPPEVADLSTKTEIFETGIKVIDLLTPFVRGGKAGLFGGAGLGKTVILTELIARIASGPRRLLASSPASASGPAKATTSGWKCRKRRSAAPAATCIEQTCMVFGQMNEPPGRPACAWPCRP